MIDRLTPPEKGAGSPKSPDGFPWHLVRTVLIWCAAFVAAGAVAIVVGLMMIKPAPPDLAAIWERQGEPSITILDKDDQLVMTRGAREAPIVPLSEMPPYLWQAFLSIEDRRYYDHGAVDPIGIVRAILVNLQN